MEDALLREIREFCEETGLSGRYLGKAAANNSEIYPRLLAGRTITLATEKKLRKYMSLRLRRQRRWMRRLEAAE